MVTRGIDWTASDVIDMVGQPWRIVARLRSKLVTVANVSRVSRLDRVAGKFAFKRFYADKIVNDNSVIMHQRTRVSCHIRRFFEKRKIMKRETRERDEQKLI